MRRLVAAVTALVLVPSGIAAAADLDELLDRSSEASFSAEQIISCVTPDGQRDAVVRISQHDGAIWVAPSVDGDVEVAASDGGWTLVRGGGVVASASVASGDDSVEPLYVVDELGETTVLGRPATAHQLVRDGVLRAELVFDDETGAMLGATTYLDDGSTYCQRRLVSFDPTAPNKQSVAPADEPDVGSDVESTTLPESLAGFSRLDLYVEDDGSTFAYYSDGFFSFAVFETPTKVTLDEYMTVEVDGSLYDRSFTAGQATYVWETTSVGMALIGDLPPDMHQAILSELPESDRPGIFRRLWRSLFG